MSHCGAVKNFEQIELPTVRLKPKNFTWNGKKNENDKTDSTSWIVLRYCSAFALEGVGGGWTTG